MAVSVTNVKDDYLLPYEYKQSPRQTLSRFWTNEVIDFREGVDKICTKITDIHQDKDIHGDKFWDEALLKNIKDPCKLNELLTTLVRAKATKQIDKKVMKDQSMDTRKVFEANRASKIKQFVKKYLKMEQENKCDTIQRSGTLNALYECFCKTEDMKTSPLLKVKKYRDEQMVQLTNETPFQLFLRIKHSIIRLLKHAAHRKHRFDAQLRNNLGMSEETADLAEYKGCHYYLEPEKEIDQTLRRLRKEYKSSKTEEEFKKELKGAKLKKKDADIRFKKIKEEKELQEFLQKSEILSKKYGEELSRLNMKENKLLKNVDYYKDKKRFLTNKFRIHMRNESKIIRGVRCTIDSEEQIHQPQKLFNAREYLQSVHPKEAFEKLQYIPGRRITQQNEINDEVMLNSLR